MTDGPSLLFSIIKVTHAVKTGNEAELALAHPKLRPLIEAFNERKCQNCMTLEDNIIKIEDNCQTELDEQVKSYQKTIDELRKKLDSSK